MKKLRLVVVLAVLVLLAACGQSETLEMTGGLPKTSFASAAPEPEMWHNLRVDAHPNAIGELSQVYRDAQDLANRVAAFYKGAIRIKPYYWRRVGAPMK